MSDELPDWLTEDEDEDALPWLTPSYLRRDEASGVIGTMAPQLDTADAEHMDWLDNFLSQARTTMREEARGFPKTAAEMKDDGRTWFVASTDHEARDGHIFEQQWRLQQWRKNNVILYEHTPEVIGRGVARAVRGDENGLLVGSEWHRSELNPRALLVAEQHDTGFRHAVSVRMIPGQAINRAKLPADDPRHQDLPTWQAGMVFRFPVLLEVSSVAVPADARAIQIRSWVQEVEDPSEQLARLLRETAGPEARALILRAVRERPELRRALLGTLPLGSEPITPPALPAFLKEG